jgi:hypothetical protein
VIPQERRDKVGARGSTFLITQTILLLMFTSLELSKELFNACKRLVGKSISPIYDRMG